MRCGTPTIFHADPGAQFTANAFTSVLQAAGIRISMAWKGAWRDNILIQRFWWNLKHEEVYPRAYDSVWDARRHLSARLDYYNSERAHPSLEYTTPVEAYSQSLPATPPATPLPANSQPQGQVMSL